jgi:hypothetical protein
VQSKRSPTTSFKARTMPPKNPNNTNQAESNVPRGPPETVSLAQAQRVVNLLQAARDEFLQLITAFPPGHHTIRAVISQYPNITAQEFERILDEGRRLLVHLRDEFSHVPTRDRAREGVILHGRVERQYIKLRDKLDILTDELGEYNHLRTRQAPPPPQNRPGPSRPMGQDLYNHLRTSRAPPPQPSLSRPAGPAQPLSQLNPSQSSRPMGPPPQNSHPSPPPPQYQAGHRRQRSYQELLEENQELREENRLLSDHLRRADRLIARLSEGGEDEDEEDDEDENGGKRTRL